LSFAATLRQYRREEQATQEQAEALITVATEHGFPQGLQWGTILRGWALAEQGQEEEGIAQIRQGLAGLRATGVETFTPYFLALLAEAYEKAGQIEEGLSMLADALPVRDKSRFWDAELYRLKGELLLAQEIKSQKQEEAGGWRLETGPSPQAPSLKPHVSSEAEACFLKAIEVACRQQAKSLELRATVSLARLWQQQGKQAEAYRMLSEIYGWFTEGFDTKDLQEAKALLNMLAKD
jgi:predicted ATPase